MVYRAAKGQSYCSESKPVPLRRVNRRPVRMGGEQPEFLDGLRFDSLAAAA